ncbi:UDP-3-O-[3-hydroxymyristoyl] glucosamine N-acyltransferase [Selenomonas ruminantium]|uniref:UDP-3-O-acylglucosamine N-acyltransferase n=1 Tax=Selenomonas ruminantium TaxID=971 RepID=A0A1M6TSD2_SELRU|nr:UDP-3-O-(3-hydroxymyristoyl)glucosamine N-acyltransferase [Selenomonas ruminantium]SHK59861.1 UDP-3-O-[3-hydroxymyristoyl] glucosamine N-acyltransferase [Selenomonas ruminantium]
MKKTLQEIAEIVGGRVAGEAGVEITGLDNIDGAGANDLTFAVEPHIEKAKTCKAAAVMLPEGVTDFPKTALYVEDPRAAFAKLLDIFTPKLERPVGVSDKAHVGKDVKLGQNVTIMPFAMVDDHAVIGDNVVIYPHTYIGQYAEIDDDTVIYSNATVREYCRVGKRCVIHSSAVIGSDGFGFTTKDGVHTKVPQVGIVVLEDDVEIGAHDGIDRAAMGATVIGKGTKIDNLVHIGHNCKIGANCLIVAQTGISGSTTVGHNVTFGGQTGTVGHIHIGANSVYAARAGIIGDMPEGVFCAGFPVQPHTEWLRMQALMKHLPEMNKKIKQLEKKLAKYEG